MSRILAPVAALIAAASGCAPTVDLAEARAALEQSDARYSEAAQGKDVDAWVSMYTSDATMYPPGLATISGIDAIRDFGTEFTSMPGFAASFRPVEVDVGDGGDLGYTLNEFVITFTGPEGQPVTEQGRDFHVWRRQADGAWKVVIDIWNSDQPASPEQPAPPAPAE